MVLNVTTEDKKTSSTLLLPPLEQIRHCFSMAELSLATDNFNEKWCIGHGGFGKAYKGKFSNGSTNIYAIKRLHFMSDQGEPEFWVEVEMLSRLRQCNLVSLIGYCNEGKDMALVYEYMRNGTLSDHLHKKGTHFTWSQWLKICIGAARGLDYLHTGIGTQQGVIHHDVKSSNILLDQNYAAKIADFGLAKTGPTNQTCTYINTTVKGTFVYMDPNYFNTERLTRKSDVYAFGVVLLEVLSGRPALDKNLDEGLAVWAQDQIKQGKLSRIVSSSLRDHISKSSLKEFSGIAVRCLFSRPNQRPTMTEILGSLDRALSFQERKDSSAQGGNTIWNVWSFLSLKGHFELRSSGTAESKKLNGSTATSDTLSSTFTLSPTEAFTGFPESKKSIPISNKDDWHSESSSLSGGGGLGVEYCASNALDQVSRSKKAEKNENNNQVEEAYKPDMYITLMDEQDGIDESKIVYFSWSSRNPTSSGDSNFYDQVEWNKVYEPGVLITLSPLPFVKDGTKELKRVHFSRRKFDEHKANTCWSENREKVYERYNVTMSNNTQGRYYIGPYWLDS